MVFTRLFIIGLLLFSTITDFPKDRTIFVSPVNIPILLSANFGELRIDHFHSGIDIKTQGVAGKEVVAADEGYIYRISVSPGGFGKALYIRHPSGFSTVYAHLDRFTPEIDDYVINQQYDRKSYLVTLFPSKDKFPVKQGDLIAFSGNSGSSGGPHLHFEIRKSDNEIPINPLFFDLGIEDNIKPVIEKLVIYPVNSNSFINNRQQIKKVSVSGSQGRYFIPAEDEIIIKGAAGFGIKSFDLLNDSYNKCAAYTTELFIDSTLRFKYVMDGFSFNESRFINSHIDYENYMREKVYIERTFMLPNDKLSVYKDVINRGVFNFNDNKVHYIEILISDIHNNKSSLTFKVKSQSKNPVNFKKTAVENLKLMPYNRSNKFVSENISVNIPSGALYDTLYFSYATDAGTKEMLSDLHYIHNKYTPLQKAIKLSIKPSVIPSGKESKMLIVQLGDNQEKNALSSKWEEGYLTCEALAFGRYYIGIDTIPPVISTNGLISGSNLSGKKDIKIKISDDFSGIKYYEGAIDGNWALFEYDQKNNLLIYRFDEKRIDKNMKHELSLKTTDNKDNTGFFSCDFIW